MLSNYKYSMSPQMRVLSDYQIEKIHLATCEVLEKTGVKMGNDKAKEILYGAGAYIGPNSTVYIPSSLVDNALNTVPHRIVLCNREGKRVIKLEEHKVYWIANPDCPIYIDPYSHERRKWVSKDAKDIGVLIDYLPNIDGVLTQTFSADYPPEVGDRVMVRQMFLNCTKTVGFNCKDVNSLKDIIDMASIVAGSEEELKKNPCIFHIQEPVSPLMHDPNSSAEIILCAEKGIPIVWYPMPLGGSTAPTTMAGRLVQGNAEVLAGVVLHQLVSPGAPIIYGSIPSIMDMKTTKCAYTSPELNLGAAASSDIAHYYKIPMWGTAGMTDAKSVDSQAASDYTLSSLMSALSGANLIHDVGILDGDNITCPESFILANEIIGMVKHIMKGIEINEETLALDLIDKIGPGGNYLSEEHTLKHFRSFWEPLVFDRTILHSMNEVPLLSKKMNSKATEIIENHEVPFLADDKKKALLELEKKWLK